MKALGFGLFFALIAWAALTWTPWLDPTGLNEAMGMTNDEAALVSLFLILGACIGGLWETIGQQAKLHDKLAAHVERLEDAIRNL
jgi:hypothetical protein